MKKWLVSLVLFAAVPAQAHWHLDSDQSALSFVSTKAINIAEVHRFGTLSGVVDDEGQVAISIDLASVDTAIELRDERMREMLFDTAENPTAEISATIDSDALSALAPGQSTDMAVEAMLALHGTERPVTMEVVVARSGENSLLVTTKKPIIINAAEYALGDGVEALRAIAGLPSISLAVPVSFVLAFGKE
ncbi:MAG: YceI family protein [Gammaproteobacteria bacterium]|nr:YceI family protein [Gammaproteobacteria bacterium]